MLHTDVLGQEEDHSLEKTRGFLGRRLSATFTYRNFNVHNTPDREFIGVITGVAFSGSQKEEQSITLTITKDSILCEAAGYQLFQQYLLNGKIEQNTMRLKYLSAIVNTTSAVLEKTTDFGSIVYDGKKYTWQCPYINLSFGDGKPKDFILEKK